MSLSEQRYSMLIINKIFNKEIDMELNIPLEYLLFSWSLVSNYKDLKYKILLRKYLSLSAEYIKEKWNRVSKEMVKTKILTNKLMIN